MKEAKKPLNRRIPRAAERGERSRKAEGGEWSLPNGHLPFRRTSAAGSMAAPHFHDRVPPSLSRSPRRCIECVHPCVLPLAARTRSTRSSPPRRRPASSALVRRARISNLFPREGNNGGDDGGGWIGRNRVSMGRENWALRDLRAREAASFESSFFFSFFFFFRPWFFPVMEGSSLRQGLNLYT